MFSIENYLDDVPLICGTKIFKWTERYLEEKSKHNLKFTPRNFRSVSFTINDELVVQLFFNPEWILNRSDSVRYYILLGGVGGEDGNEHATALIYDITTGGFFYIDPYSTINGHCDSIVSLLKTFKLIGLKVTSLTFYPDNDYGIQMYQEMDGLMDTNDPRGYCIYWVYYIIDTMIRRGFAFNKLHENLVLSISNDEPLTHVIRNYVRYLIVMTYRDSFKRMKKPKYNIKDLCFDMNQLTLS